MFKKLLVNINIIFKCEAGFIYQLISLYISIDLGDIANIYLNEK